jgi:glycosyltransferase involved in cell wall biosynthesis
MTDTAVIIPCHNGAAYLRPAIDSALRQSSAPGRIVVVDDGSTDDSVAIAARYGDPVTVISGRFGGAAAARLAGLQLVADAERFMFLDADDLLGRGVLAVLNAALDAAPGQIAAGPWHRYRLENEAWHVEPPSCAPRAGRSPLAAWLRGWYHPPCSVLWSREAYERSGGWDADIPVNNDGDLMMRALVAGAELRLTTAGESFYRRPTGAETVSSRRKTETGLNSRLRVLGRIAARLKAAGRLDDFRSDVAFALGLLRADAGAGTAERGAIERALQGLAGGSWPDGMHDLPVNGGVKAARPVTVSTPADTTAPPVSVVIPTFNRRERTLRTIETVLAQGFTRFELLVVDDASTDGTVEALLGVDDQRLRIVRQEANGGVAAARNRGLREARGEWIAFLDSDDGWRPRKLERQMEVARNAGRDTGLVHALAATRTEDGTVPPPHRPESGDLWSTLLMTNVLHGAPSSALLHRSVWETIGGFDTALPAIEDWDYWIRAARFFDVAIVDEVLVDYDDSAPVARRSRSLARNIRARLQLFERHEAALARFGLGGPFLRETAHRILRDRAGWSPEGGALLARCALAHRYLARRHLHQIATRPS